MILYLDTSALVKKYTTEFGSDMVHQVIDAADSVGMSVIGKVEMSATFAKLIRVGALEPEESLVALQLFKSQWPDLMQLDVTKMVIEQAGMFAWEYHLRGYDAVHLASAVLWQETLRKPVTMAVFDRKLWQAAEQVGVRPFPDNLDN